MTAGKLITLTEVVKSDIEEITQWLPPIAFKDITVQKAITRVTEGAISLADIKDKIGISVSNEELETFIVLATNNNGKMSLKDFCSLFLGTPFKRVFKFMQDVGLMNNHDNMVLVGDTMKEVIFKGHKVPYKDHVLFNASKSNETYTVRVNLLSPYLSNLIALLDEEGLVGDDTNGDILTQRRAMKVNPTINKMYSEV